MTRLVISKRLFLGVFFSRWKMLIKGRSSSPIVRRGGAARGDATVEPNCVCRCGIYFHVQPLIIQDPGTCQSRRACACAGARTGGDVTPHYRHGLTSTWKVRRSLKPGGILKYLMHSSFLFPASELWERTREAFRSSDFPRSRD